MPPTDPEALNIMPSGFIIRWYCAAAIPAGWVICDGKNNTPDLVKSFAVTKNISEPAHVSSTHSIVFIMKN